jgi:DNA-directed RNA polymerase specialized sigma subunit
MVRKYEAEELAAIEEAKNYLSGYRVCRDLLGLQRYERKRSAAELLSTDAELLSGDEMLWRSRMYAISALLGNLKNGREKLMLYYYFIKGESVERIAVRLGVSRRTGFRIFQKGLLMAAECRRQEKTL